MMRRSLRLALLSTSFALAELPAQAAPSTAAEASTPEALATLVMRTFSSGTPVEFAAVYPDSAGRVFMREGRGTRVAQLSRVVWKGRSRAVLLLGGVVRAETGPRGSAAGSNETNAARHFSGLYEAVEQGGSWRITAPIPLDSANYIRTQDLHVTVTPSTGIEVVDTLSITVGTPYGFGVRLNSRVALRDVRLDGAPIEHAFGGGVLWVKAPAKASSKLVLSYALEGSRGPQAQAGAADSAARAGPPAYGAFFNTDVWHPFFDYLSANDMAQINVTARVPAEYYLTTTLPQTDSVRDGIRTVHARSIAEEFLAALIYDRDWRPKSTDFGTFRFESFTTPDFRHTHDSLAAVTKRVYDVLVPRFGEPHGPARYLAAVQARAVGTGGFNVRMNNAAVSGSGGGGAALETATFQTFAHETGHAWTMNATGRAANFLREAWAVYVESIMYRALYRPEDERAFWERQRNGYEVGADRAGFAGGFEGQQSILANYDNGRIHYRKGSWIFNSGNYVMGDSAFNRGMRTFIEGTGKGPSGYEELIAAWSKAVGRDMTSFVMPWLRSRYTPDVDAHVEGTRLIVTQRQPGELFDLPKLAVELTTAGGPVRTELHSRRRADTVDIGNVGPVTEIRVDPDHRYLLRRAWGEPAVRFEFPALRAPDAKSVKLAGDFTRAPIAATRVGDAWVVEIPMTDGHYTWRWQIDDRPAAPGAAGIPESVMTGTRTVRPLQRVTNAYPGR